jgi:hypothetical protein
MAPAKPSGTLDANFAPSKSGSAHESWLNDLCGAGEIANRLI